MAIEIEKKYVLRAEQYERVLNELKNSEAKFIGEDFEENIIYGGGILSKQTAILRVRNVEDKSILTYKRRVQSNSDVKHQIEYETEVKNAEELESIIESLGFEKKLVYEKRRKTWKLREVEIVLDELPFGFYMEIEGLEMEIIKAEMILGAKDFIVEHQTYPRLTLEFGKSIGSIIEARFLERKEISKNF